MLEAQINAFNKITQELTQTSQQLDNMEGQVQQFTGALESFLG